MASDDTRECVTDLFSSIIKPLACSLQHESQEITLRGDSLAHKLYGDVQINEKFNCNYSLNERYKNKFHDSPLRSVGTNLAGDMRMIELRDHPFYLAMLFQPQLAPPKSSGHPVIMAFLKASQDF